MFSIGICDDNEIILYKLTEFVKNSLEIESVEFGIQAFSDPFDLMRYIDNHYLDLLLLDIELPGINGMEIAEQLNKMPNTPILIFITSHESLVYESFRYKPFDFIRKKYYETDLKISLQRVVNYFFSKENTYTIEYMKGQKKIMLNDILFFEACSNYVRIVLRHGEIKQRKNLYQIEEELGKYGFIRIHKSYLVNQQAIYILKTNEVILENKEELPIGRAYKEVAKNRILNFLRG